ncbi:MAG: RsmB/NOP family class I SAM-dependent RNA methyltransferase [Burkholderiales bacterium]|nr:RsmB/NOP family class I SAM-dependent RNA methyltransferase [Burkholderiales bacterium]
MAAKPAHKPRRYHPRPRTRRAGKATPDALAPSSAPGAQAVIRAFLVTLGCEALAAALALEAPADVVLRRYFREHPKLGRRDRGFIAETTFAVLRRLRRYSALAGTQDPRRLFVLAAHERRVEDGRDLGPALSADERAWLAHIDAASPPATALGVRAELPDWVIELMQSTASADEILAIGLGMQSSAPLDLRVNTLLASRAQALAALEASGIAAEPTPYSPVGIRVRGKPALEEHPLYRSGTIEVQDEGSQLLGFLLAPRRREMVVDFCAGAGGKTLLLGALMRSEGRLYAFDVSAARIHRLRTRLARSGLSNVQPEVVAHENDARLKRLAGKIDRVLVDAPCTGFGTLRRNPDLKWRQRPEDLAVLRDKQSRILAAAARLLKPGGRLVYATCSFLGAENDAIVDAFRARHPQLVELDCAHILARQGIGVDCGSRLRLYPHRHGTDAFFAAAFESPKALA